MALDAEELRIGRDRISRVFHYLQALNQHRNPAKRQIREQPWSLWLHDLPENPSILQGNIGKATQSEESEAESDRHQASRDFILKVRRPRLTQPSNPPELLREWLDRGWEDPFQDVRIRDSRNEVDAQGQTRIVRFEEDMERSRAFESWKSRRDQWARNERPARRAMKIFEQLYELHGRIEREAERVELILGDGILTWRRPEGGITHPILLQRLQLDFNASVPEFTVIESDRGVELYSALFRSMADVDGKAIARCREELEQGDFHPLEEDGTSGFLKRLVVQLSPRGEFIGSRVSQAESEDPHISRDPVIFLRSRILGFATAIEAVLTDLQEGRDLPGSLLNIVGIQPLSEELDEAKPSSETWNVPEEILLSKDANPEQIRIAQRLESHGCVLVQGPPGTGKTHTIANLIGHLLAHGKSVLVTSHATKALRVLRDQVVEKLRPLCVSVLERDIDSRRQMESSVEAIVERLSVSDERLLESEAIASMARRHDILNKFLCLREELLSARADEYRDIVVAGEGYSPSEAARKVAVEREEKDWIPPHVELGSGLPLSEAEILDLYRTNADLSPEDESELGHILPNPEEFPTPEDFDRMVKEKQRLIESDLGFRSDLWSSPPGQEGLEELEALAEKLPKSMSSIDGVESWKLAAVSAGQSGGPTRKPWDSLLALIKQVYDKAGNAQEILMRHAPVLSNEISSSDQRHIAAEILTHLRRGSTLSKLTLLKRRSWRRFVQQTRVSTSAPSRIEHFLALFTLAGLDISRSELCDRWDRQVAALGATSAAEFGGEPEKVCSQYAHAISQSLEWYTDVWRPLETALINLGFRWEPFMGEQPPNVSSYGALLRLRDAVLTSLPGILSARRNAIRWEKLEVELDSLARKLTYAGNGDTSEGVMDRLREAVTSITPDQYREAFQRWVDLWHLRNRNELRRELLARLESVAPGWSSAIRDRRGQHGKGNPPGDIKGAWLWRQLQDELQHRSEISLEHLQQSIVKRTEELRQVTADLIDRRAWAAQVRRTTLHQRQVLIGWLDTIRKIGKGYGKRVPRLRAEAAQKMSECRTSVPVWIMPLSRVVENFDPRTTRFDVAIIDEASQCDVMALLVFYLARKVVVVGDHEQVSPSAVGQELAVVQHLIDEHLQGIPNAQLYDGQMSVYDLARQSFGATTCLLEHFRCVPEIIQFSNHLSYDGRIKPLRDPSLVSLRPHVVSYRVRPSLSETKVNKEEAWRVSTLLAAAVEQPEYLGKTFGVISLVGDDQAQEIERILLRQISPEDYQKRRILCGNAAHFQGDERDVMFLSTVDIAVGGPLSLRDQQMFKQRFNVAASRAKDQMWVVHSLDPKNDLKPGDLRKRLLEHAEDPQALLRAMESGEQRVESELEKAVLRRLVQAGYRVLPQYQVGYYRIDLVVEGGSKRLAIECDGDRYHLIEKLEDDMARQALLERLGWTFSRIRGSEFYRDPAKALEPVFNRLEELEIPPEGAKAPADSSFSDTELKERVIRRAEELLRQWRELEFSEEEKGFEEGNAERKGNENPTDLGTNEEQPSSGGGNVDASGTSSSYGRYAETGVQAEPEVDWVLEKGPSTFRRLHRWCKESKNSNQSDASAAYWVAQDLERNKKVSLANARKVKRLFEKAIRKGFSPRH